MAKDITILFISDSENFRESVPNILPVGVKAVFSGFTADEIRETLYSRKPSGIYIVFEKGERAGTKELSDVFSYARGLGVRLSVTGSFPQFRSVREMFGKDTIYHVKEKELRRSILDLRNSITDSEKKEKYRKSYRVAAVTSDLHIAAICEDAFSSSESGIRFICSDDIGSFTVGTSTAPDLFLVSENEIFSKGILSDIKKSFGEIPYILLETGGFSADKPEYEPCCRIDISRNNFSLRSVTENVLKEL